MDPMPVVAGDAHRAHDPPYEVDYGEVVRPVYERVERAERLRDALAAAGHPLVPPAGHGPAPILAVHEPALVGFLEEAWPAWRAAGGPEVLIPDSFAVGHLGRGGGGRDLGGGVGRAGWFCFDTATPLVAGSFGAAVAAADAALTAADLVAGDFHHGNGTQDIFWEDPDVLYVSLHGDPASHYPHFLGAADETGGGAGEGANRNLPLPDGTGDDAYLEALTEAMALVAAFDPATLVVSAGFDTFAGDPLGAFAVTTEGYRRIGAALAGVGRPTVVVQEGGYAVEANAVALLDGLGQAR
jgi:acetoin utilization deacetylase AcuC-like enzyme